MVTAIVVLGLCAAVVQGVPLKRQLGICIQGCTHVGVGTSNGCPEGQTCTTLNRCDSWCQPMCIETCSPAGSGQMDPCPAGKNCTFNGCGHMCLSVAHKGRSIVEPKCPPVMCDLYCSNGFATGADGCPMCSCNSNALPVDLQKLFGTLG